MRRGIVAVMCTLWLSAWGSPAVGGETAVRASAEGAAQVRATLESMRRSKKCDTQDVAAVFDYHEFARRALGRHWRDRTEAERAQLVELLRIHLLGWYWRLCRRQESVSLQDPTVDGERAIIPGSAIRDGHGVRVLYRLHSSTGAGWLVYDVEVAGRSHAETLYAEVDRTLLNEGYRNLVARLAQEQGVTAPSR